mmetsp:Transcript_22882/g.53960  ORF Transcript_22882/g.53960 Transcript_22882/m.53960 type:complete len:104 (+) Transcript_22882:995-1306(+)
MARAAGPLPKTRTSHSSELAGLLCWAGGTDAAREKRRVLVLPVIALAEMLGSYVSVGLHVRRSQAVLAAGGAPTNAVARPSDAADTATVADVGLILRLRSQCK